MSNQSTHSTIPRILFVLLLLSGAACAAPTPPSPSASQMDIEIATAPPKTPVTDLAGQIIGPLITVGKDGSFQPGLAESWETTVTVDGKFLQVDFLLATDWALDNNSSISVDYIPQAIQDMASLWKDDPGLVSSGDLGGNPCILTLPRVGFRAFNPPSILPVSDDRTISMIIPLSEDCPTESAICAAPSMNLVANAPIYNPDAYTYMWRTSTGLDVLEDSSGMKVTFDRQTGATEQCTGPECQQRDPSSYVLCTPTPTKEP